MAYNDNPYNFDESAARGTASAPPENPFLNYYTPYQTTIAGQNVSIGDPSVTNDAQAIAYLRNQEQANAATGSVDSKYWQALNPGMSAKDMQAYQALRDKYVKGTSFDSLANHLGPWPGIVGTAIIGGAAVGAAAGAGGTAAGGGSSIGMTAGGGALSTDAALGAAADAGVGAFGSGAAGLGTGAAGAGAAGAGAALGAGGAADAALPEILVQGSLPAASSGGLFAGAGDAALGALANSQVGQAPTSGSSSNPFTSFVTNHASDLAQLGLAAAAPGGAGGGGGNGGGGPGPAGVMPNYGSGYTDSNGAPLTSLSFPRSGFRDQGAFDYLLQSLGLPSPGASAAAGGQMAPQGYAPQAAPPSGLDNFAGMDFSSVFQGLVNPNSGSFGIPSPSPTAQASGTRGPAPDAMGTVNDLAGTFGNGGAAMGTKTIPTNPWIKISRGSYQ